MAIAATIYVCYRFAEETVGALGEQCTERGGAVVDLVAASASGILAIDVERL